MCKENRFYDGRTQVQGVEIVSRAIRDNWVIGHVPQPALLATVHVPYIATTGVDEKDNRSILRSSFKQWERNIKAITKLIN